MSELGRLLRSLRGKRSLRDVGKSTGLSHSYLSMLENGFDPRSKTPINPSPDTLKRLSDAYSCPYEELMRLAGYLQDSPESSDWDSKLPELTDKDERDIAKKLEGILEQLNSDTGLAFDGEPMDEDTRELVAAQIERNLRTTKQLAKKKFTPKKYRK